MVLALLGVAGSAGSDNPASRDAGQALVVLLPSIVASAVGAVLMRKKAVLQCDRCGATIAVG